MGDPAGAPLQASLPAGEKEREKRECFSKVSLVQMLHRMDNSGHAWVLAAWGPGTPHSYTLPTLVY